MLNTNHSDPDSENAPPGLTSSEAPPFPPKIAFPALTKAGSEVTLETATEPVDRHPELVLGGTRRSGGSDPHRGCWHDLRLRDAAARYCRRSSEIRRSHSHSGQGFRALY